MRYERVFLLKPKYKGTYYGALHPPVWIGYIAESLAQHQIEYDVMDMSLKYKISGVIKKMRKFDLDLLGVTMMSFMNKDISELIRRIKQAIPHIHVVIGGAHASTYREEILE